MLHPLTEFLSRLPHKCSSIGVAGGAAADFERAGDIDVWFRMKDRAVAESYLQRAAYFTLRTESNYGGEELNGEVIGEAYDPSGKVVQVILYPHKDLIEGLLTGFDISTHQIAVLSTGKVVTGPNWTPLEKPPQVIQWKNRTFERYIKICKRYGHPVDLDVLSQAPKTLNPTYHAPYHTITNSAAKGTADLLQEWKETMKSLKGMVTKTPYPTFSWDLEDVETAALPKPSKALYGLDSGLLAPTIE